MAVIRVTFTCGHQAVLTGQEEHPRCECGEDRIQDVTAPPPSFHGHARGPCAKYEELPAKPVILG